MASRLLRPSSLWLRITCSAEVLSPQALYRAEDTESMNLIRIGLRGLVLFASMLVVIGCSDSQRGESGGVDVPSSVAEQGYAFVGVNVLPVITDEVLYDQTVLIQQGRVQRIAPVDSVSVPVGFEVIEATGKYLMPGLADMHSPPMNQNDLSLFLANGVTQIRSMWSEPSLLELREQINSGLVPGPRIFASGRIVDGHPPVHFGTTVVSKPEDAAEVVRRQAEDGYDFLKNYSHMSLESFDETVAAGQEQGVEISGHVPYAVSITHAIGSGMKSMEHIKGYRDYVQVGERDINALRLLFGTGGAALFADIGEGRVKVSDLYDAQKLTEIAQLTAAEDVWNVPTLVVLKGMSSYPLAEEDKRQYLSPAVRSFWSVVDAANAFASPAVKEGKRQMLEIDIDIVRKLHEAGANLMVGTDAPNLNVLVGYAVLEEMELFVRAGMSNLEAIRAATMEPAKYLGEGDERGHLREGVVADLILVEGNPLENLRSLREILGVMRVVSDGELTQWHTQAELQARLDTMSGTYAALIEELDAAPLQADSMGRVDFSSEDAMLSANVARTPDALNIEFAVRDKRGEPGDWQTIQLDQGEAGTAIRNAGGHYRLVADDGKLVLDRDGENIVTAEAPTGKAYLLTGTPMDLSLLHEQLSGIAVGESESIQAWQCESLTTCDSPEISEWRVTRGSDDIVEGHFYYTGHRYFEVESGGESIGHLRIGGGFYEGAPVEMVLTDKRMSVLQRVR
ncbi:MAG: amidohydrolase family protein [Pseudomonadota bacterium]